MSTWFDTVVVASEEQISTFLSDEAVILSMKKGRYFSLDGVGAFVWKLMASPVPVRELHEAVLAAYDVDAELASEDLFRLLDELRDAGLIEVRDAG